MTGRQSIVPDWKGTEALLGLLDRTQRLATTWGELRSCFVVPEALVDALVRGVEKRPGKRDILNDLSIGLTRWKCSTLLEEMAVPAC